MKKIPHIGLQISDLFNDEFIFQSKKELETDGLDIDLEVYPSNRVYGMAEWALPTAFVIYILKSYFDGFLKEAGKDHYALLKNFLKSKAEILKPIPLVTVVSEESPNKIDKNNTQSKVFSIESITYNGVKIKFLFDNNLTIDEWKDAIEKALILLENNHFKLINDDIAVAENKLTGYQLFAIFDSQSMEWQFLDYRTSYLKKMK